MTILELVFHVNFSLGVAAVNKILLYIDAEVVNVLDENEEPSLEGNEFTKGVNEGQIDVQEEDLDDETTGGGPKKPAQPKA
jgi:hypothetical protein